MSKDFKIAQLMDFYSGMLTDKQRDVMEMYYFDDLSLSEIAEQENITRQGVHDSIKRGETIILELDKKLALADKLIKYKQIFENIKTLTADIHNEAVSADIKNIAEKSSLILDCIENADSVF